MHLNASLFLSSFPLCYHTMVENYCYNYSFWLQPLPSAVQDCRFGVHPKGKRISEKEADYYIMIIANSFVIMIL